MRFFHAQSLCEMSINPTTTCSVASPMRYTMFVHKNEALLFSSDHIKSEKFHPYAK